MKNNKKSVYVVIVVLLVVVVGLSIAYAALSTTLTITFGNAIQDKLTWAVAFKSETITGQAGGSSATGRSCGSATASGTTVTVAETHLSKPGDKCYWLATVQNTGGINAKLNTLTATAPSGITCTIAPAKNTMTCGNIKYSLGTNANCTTLLTTGGALNKTNGTNSVYVCAEYVGTGINSSDVSQTGAKFTLTYIQN